MAILLIWSFMTLGIGISSRQETALILHIDTLSRETFQLFWKDRHHSFDQKNSIRIQLDPNQTLYRFSLPGFAVYDTLRIDPVDRESRLIIRSLKFQIRGSTGLELHREDEFREFLELLPGVSLAAAPHGSGVLIAAGGNDPQLLLDTKIWPLLVRGYGPTLLAAIMLSLLTLYCLAWAKARQCLWQGIQGNRGRYVLPAAACFFSGYLSLAIPVELLQNAEISSWLGASVVGAVWLYIAGSFFITRESRWSYATNRSSGWFKYALPSLIVFSVYLLAFWPASMSPDSLDQWKQVLKFSFKDWHPVFHTLFLWVVTRAWLSPVMPALMQICLLAGACGWVLSRLRSLGVSPPVLLLVAFIFAILPVNGLMAVTIWKDIPYSVAMMVLAVLLLELALSSGTWLDSKKNACLLIVAAVCVSLFRHNGIFPAFGTFLVCILVFPRRWKQLLVVLLITVSCHSLVRGPVYHWLDVDRNNPLSHITGKLELKAQTMLKKLLFQENEVDTKVAKPYGKGDKVEGFDESLERAIAVRLDSSSVLWRVRPLQGYYGRVDHVNLWHERSGDELQIRYISSNKFQLYESPVLPMVTKWLFRVFERSKDSPWLFWMWRPAFFLYALVFAAAVASLRHRKAIMLVMVPILLNSLPVLFFVSQSSIYRYHYAIVLTAIILAFPLLFTSLTIQDERP